jgi:hypothetical protein
MLRGALRSGRLTAVHPGVYRLLGAPATPAQLLLAATLRSGPQAAASHRSAAHLWDLRPDPSRLEVVVPHDVRPRPRGVVIHRSMDLDPNHFTRKGAIPLTKPARTIVDLASVLDRAQLAEVIDRALMRQLVSTLGIRTMIGELARSGRRGPALVRDLLDNHPLGGERPESVLESVMAAIVQYSPREGQIIYQHSVRFGRRTFRMDFAAPHVKVGIEVLGLAEHGTREAVLHDSERRRILTLHGWEILEYTKRDMKRAPKRVAREICQFVKDRESQFPGWALIG